MARFGIIFGLVFQSVVLIWCAGRTPVALVAAESQSCAAAPVSHESACCCSSDEDATGAAEAQFVQAEPLSVPERCCQCPITAEDPRVPALPDRRPGLELTRVPIEIVSTIELVFPVRSTLSLSSVPVTVHPPDFSGRLACERFCRWTI